MSEHNLGWTHIKILQVLNDNPQKFYTRDEIKEELGRNPAVRTANLFPDLNWENRLEELCKLELVQKCEIENEERFKIDGRGRTILAQENTKPSRSPQDWVKGGLKPAHSYTGEVERRRGGQRRDSERF